MVHYFFDLALSSIFALYLLTACWPLRMHSIVAVVISGRRSVPPLMGSSKDFGFAFGSDFYVVFLCPCMCQLLMDSQKHFGFDKV